MSDTDIYNTLSLKRIVHAATRVGNSVYPIYSLACGNTVHMEREVYKNRTLFHYCLEPLLGSC